MNRDLKVLAAALFAMALGEGLFLPLAPLYMEDLGAKPEQIGLFAALFSAAQLISMIPSGMAADRWGPRPVLLIGWFVALLAAAMMAFAPGLDVFAIGYAGYGLTFGVIPAISSAIAHNRGRSTPEWAFTRVFSFFLAGFIISPILGGLIGEKFGLQTGYRLAIILIGISFAIMFGIGSTGGSSVQERQKPLALVRQRDYRLLLIVVFFTVFATWLGMPLAPVFLQDKWQIPISRVGFLSAISSAGGVLMAQYLGGKRPRRVLIFLQIAVGIYLIVMLRVGQFGWLSLAFFLQAGARLSRQFLDAVSVRIVKPSQLGLAFALNSSAGRAADVVAASLAGYLYAAQPSLPFQVSLGLLPLVAVFIWWKLPRAEEEPDLSTQVNTGASQLNSRDQVSR